MVWNLSGGPQYRGEEICTEIKHKTEGSKLAGRQNTTYLIESSPSGNGGRPGGPTTPSLSAGRRGGAFGTTHLCFQRGCLFWVTPMCSVGFLVCAEDGAVGLLS